jgi:histidinol dehydrogenase
MRIIKGNALKSDFFSYQDTGDIIAVRKIINEVRQNGDDALRRYTLRFDNVSLTQMRVTTSEIRTAYKKVRPEVISALKQTAKNIRTFARKQLSQFEDFEIEITPGVFAGQKIVPIKRVGVYVPGGKFPLASTLLMCAIPAEVASVSEIVVCSPPSYNGSIHPAILVASDIVGINEIYKIGGVQAIAAMAYGTETIKKVDKIVGPGNKYVTRAKKEVFGAVGVDFIAGPSEIIIIADGSANPDYISADLLAQAEHDIDAVAILITTSTKLAHKVKKAIEIQLKGLKTKGIASVSINKNGKIIIVDNSDEAIWIANKKAPEHLALQIKSPEYYMSKLKNYGSLFIGGYSSVVLGDYSSGLNHTLPTNTAARYTGGLGVKDFVKLQTTLRVKRNALSAIGRTAKTIAGIEGLDGHAKAIAVRMKE